MDVPPPHKTTTTCHTAKADMVRGTSLGPNLLAEYWEKYTYESVANSLENKYGIKFSKTIIQRALDAVAAGLEPKARNMRDRLKDADYI